jgi:hypothetical protein
MRSISFLFLGFLYLINISAALNIIEDQCSCSCCIGFNCNPISKPDFYVPLCADDDTACVRYCQMIYPFDCGQIDSQTFAACISGGSKIFNQYIVLFIAILFLGI